MPQVGVAPGAVVGVAPGAVVGVAAGAVVGVAAGAVVVVGAVATLAPAGNVTAGDVFTDETVKDNWAPEAVMVRDDRY